MGKKTPKAPDMAALGQADAANQQYAATQQNYANRPDITNPYGTQSWSTGTTTDPVTGKPITTWQKNVSLDPDIQQGMDAQQNYQKMLSEGMAGAAPGAISSALSGFDFASNPAYNFGAPEGPQRSFDYAKTPTDYREQAQESVWNRMQPAFQQKRSDTESQLANMGLTRGSEAWNREMSRLDESESQGRLQAIESGRSEAELGLKGQQQGYSQSLGEASFGNDALKQGLAGNIDYGNYVKSLREMGLGEQALQKGQGIGVLGDLNKLFGGTGGYDMNAFGFGGNDFAAASGGGFDATKAAQAQYGNQVDAYNAKAAGNAQTVGTIAAIAAAF